MLQGANAVKQRDDARLEFISCMFAQWLFNTVLSCAITASLTTYTWRVFGHLGSLTLAVCINVMSAVMSMAYALAMQRREDGDHE